MVLKLKIIKQELQFEEFKKSKETVKEKRVDKRKLRDR